MPSNPTNQHDALFRRVLGNPDDAASLLRAVLPKELVDSVDWDTLQRVPDSVVPADLRGRLGDLLFCACLRDREKYLYFLLEYQCGNDSETAIRVLDYMVCLWNELLRMAKGGKQRLPKLPPIIAIAVSMGRAGVRRAAPVRLSELTATISVPC
ncbi:Rpn family recombination-promoting nuclease/putative transposase [Nocardia alni]|uniref:Rpn family recombination-promoting nuclease/putative transposase n=1 Tax=Nocardia alni TaxID=2815723 RepID=UPI001C2172D5|nr:Rpn family recombination-promoting nuclease/putative transposase [Nocardia alni]